LDSSTSRGYAFQFSFASEQPKESGAVGIPVRSEEASTEADNESDDEPEDTPEDEPEEITKAVPLSLLPRFHSGSAVGGPGGGPFTDEEKLQNSIAPIAWPKRIEITFVFWAGRILIGWIKTVNEQMVMAHGNDRNLPFATLTLDLVNDDYVNKVRLAKRMMIGGFEGISFIELTTSQGRVFTFGIALQGAVEFTPPSHYLGLKGFHGGCAEVVDRLGVIWGA
jgi:hypothetical protein